MTGKRRVERVLCGCGLLFLLGTSSAWAQSDEEKVGEAAAARILGSVPLVEVPAAQQYLNLVGSTIAKRSEASYRWRFGLIKTDSVNAFATPGGFVMVTAGLVKQLQSEDELAMVLAHEIAHVTRRHHYRVVLRQRLADKAAKNLQAATGEAADAALSKASAQIYARGLDKASEFEADRLGVELMTQVGYDPAAALGVLERLQQLKGDDPRAELLMSTHPSAADRLDMLLQSGIDQLPRPSPDAVVQRSARFKQFLSTF
jgi:predicted Zn-dependent protease